MGFRGVLCFLFCFGTITSAASEKIVHISGQVFEWPGKVEAGDYYPSYNNVLFDAVPDQSGVTGGLKDDPYWITRFGMLIDLTSEKTLQELWNRFGKKISKSNGARTAIGRVAQDLHAYRVLRSFLADGGEIVSSNGASHYTSQPLRIYLEESPRPVLMEIAFLHELSHYLFDKTDSILYEIEDSAGADHSTIAPIEQRYVILRLLRDGKFPLDPLVRSLYGFTIEGKLGTQISARIGNSEALWRLVEPDSFLEAFVHAGMLTPLASTQLRMETKRGYALTGDQLQDLAFLNAFSAGILREAFRLATVLEKQEGVGLEKVIQGPEFQSRFRRFLTAFAKEMEHGKKSVNKAAFEIGTKIATSK